MQVKVSSPSVNSTSLTHDFANCSKDHAIRLPLDSNKPVIAPSLSSHLLTSPSKVLAVNGEKGIIGSNKTLLISYDSDAEQSLESLTDRLFATDIGGSAKNGVIGNRVNYLAADSEKSASYLKSKSENADFEFSRSSQSNEDATKASIAKVSNVVTKSTTKSVAERRSSGRFSRDDFSRISSRRLQRNPTKLRHTKSDLTLHSSANSDIKVSLIFTVVLASTWKSVATLKFILILPSVVLYKK